MSIQINVFRINGAKPSSLLREDTVEEELDKLQQGGVGTHNASRVADAIATNGDLGAVQVILFGEKLHIPPWCDIFSSFCEPKCPGIQLERRC